MNQEVMTSLTEEEMNDIIAFAENTFGVNPGNVEAEISYDISGTVLFNVDKEELTEEETISALQASIANALNIHSNDVEITIDLESGSASYTISSETAEDALELQLILQDESFNHAILDSLSNAIPELVNVPMFFFVDTTDFD